jgi:hypothetical protein
MKESRRFVWEGLELAAGLILLAGGLAGSFRFGDDIAHILALCVAAVGLVTAARPLYHLLGPSAPESSWRRRSGRAISRLAPLLLVVGTTCGIYWYLVIGQMPWKGDHPLHLYKAWHLAEHLLASGRLTGWSHFWWTGYPAESLYPFLADLLVVVIRYMTFGMAPWTAAYAWALLLTLLLYHLGIYAVGRRVLGPWAGAAAALLGALDHGGPRESGWYWTMANGVWPMALGTALWFFALERFLAVLERPTRGRVLALGALQALAMLGHPMTLMFSLLVYPIFWFLHALRVRRSEIAPPLWATIGGLALAGLLASFWYVPFFAASDYVEKVGGTWWTMLELGERIRNMDLFEGTWEGTVAFGLAGVILAWSLRHRWARDLSIAAVFMMVAVSSTTLAALDLGDVHEGFNVIHFRRFTYPMKLVWFLLGGFALTGGGALVARKALGGRGGGQPGPWRRWMWRAVAIAVFVPLVEAFVFAFYFGPLENLGRSWPLSQASHSEAFLSSNEWMQEHAAPDGRFYRVAYEVGGSGHMFYATPVFTGRPAVVYSHYTAGASFNRIFRNNGSSTMRYQLVRYVVALSDYLEKRDDLKLLHRTDHVWIYEFEDFDPDPFMVEGDARVELLEFGDERIRLGIEGASEGDELVLFVTETDRWRASLNDEPLKISTVKGNKHVRWLMSVPIEEDGELVFRYVRGPAHRLGAVLTVLGLLLVLLVIPSRRLALSLTWVQRVRGPVLRLLDRAAAPALAMCVVLGLAVVVAFLTSGDRPSSRWRMSRHFAEASVFERKGKDDLRRCVRLFDGRFRCEDGEDRFVYEGAKRTGSRHSSKLLSGILIRPFKKSETILEFPRVKMGERLVVRCGCDYLDKGRGTVPVHFVHGDEVLDRLSCPATGNWKKDVLDTEDLAGETIELKVVVKRSSSTPKLILDAWVED